MFELGQPLEREREKLSRRWKLYRIYRSLALLAGMTGYFLSIYFALTRLNPSDTFELFQLWYFSPMLVGLILNLILVRLARPHKLAVEETVFLKACSAIADLGVYIEDGKEPDRKRAEKKVNKISKELEKWDFGRLLISEKVLGSHFGPFKKAFNRKVLCAVGQREKNDLVQAYHLLRGFAKFLVNDEPRIEDINSMTKAMNEQISVTAPLKIGAERRLFRSLKEPAVSRFVIVATASAILGFAIGYIGYFVLHVPIEYAYSMAVTSGLGLLGLYVAYVRR